MILIKDIPLVNLQKAVFKLLKDGQTCAIYGDVPYNASLPYITIGAIQAKPNGSKDSVLWTISMQIDVWADKNGKKTVNDTLNDISTLISYYGTTLAVENYAVVDTNIDLAETFPEETTGYHGTLTASFTLSQNITT